MGSHSVTCHPAAVTFPPLPATKHEPYYRQNSCIYWPATEQHRNLVGTHCIYSPSTPVDNVWMMMFVRMKREKMFLLHWVPWQLYSKYIHLYEQFFQVVKDCFLLTGTIRLWLDVFECIFVLHFTLHIICCVIETWWSDPGGTATWSGRLALSYSAWILLVGSFDLKSCY